MQVLITGSAGFIGYHLAKALARQGIATYGIDSINSYYDVSLKKARLKACGIDLSPSRTGIPLYPLPQLYVQANGPL